MTGNEKRVIFIEMKQLMEDLKADLRRQFKLELREACRQIHETLTGLGIIDNDEKLLTKGQVCKIFGVSMMTVQRMMNNGTLPFIKRGESKQSPVVIRYADARIAFETSARQV